MFNSSLSRREFIRQFLLLLLLATPVGKWVVAEWRKSHPVVPKFDHVAFPLIRRVFPQLSANELASIQPMSPTAMVFYMDYTYNKPWPNFHPTTHRRPSFGGWNRRIV